jgi:tRNA nucleotidyltransferase (CCA-adding enzyme)
LREAREIALGVTAGLFSGMEGKELGEAIAGERIKRLDEFRKVAGSLDAGSRDAGPPPARG